MIRLFLGVARVDLPLGAIRLWLAGIDQSIDAS
jgi:hypothetical protein